MLAKDVVRYTYPCSALQASVCLTEEIPRPRLRYTSIDDSAILRIATPCVSQVRLVTRWVETSVVALPNNDNSHARQALLRLGRWVQFGASLLHGWNLRIADDVILSFAMKKLELYCNTNKKQISKTDLTPSRYTKIFSGSA